MAGSADGQELSGPDHGGAGGRDRNPSPQPYDQTQPGRPAQGSGPGQPPPAARTQADLSWTRMPWGSGRRSEPPTVLGQPAPGGPGAPAPLPPAPGHLSWAPTVTAGAAAGTAAAGGCGTGSAASYERGAGSGQEIVRYGPGVPGTAPGSPAGPTAEQVWREGLQVGAPRPRRPLRRLAGPALSVILLIASGVVIYLRLHHPPLGVTAVAITQQVKSGCTVDVTGRIATNGGAGTVSYQWVFQPQLAAPQPVNQSVAAGQSAVYVTAAVEGQGHGSAAQTVTLQVLGPGAGSASAHVVVSC